MTNNRSNIDVVRCISNYLIIIMHASAALQYCTGGRGEIIFWTFICGCLTQFALPALFLISGYLLFKRFSLAAYPDKIFRRVKRLLVPYVVWNVTFVCFYLFLKSIVPRLGDRVAQFGLDTFSGAFSKVLDFTVHPIDGPLWFLRTLFILALVSPIFFLILKSQLKIIRYSGFVVICVLYVICYHIGIMYSLLMTYPLYSITLFYIGGLIATSNNNADNLKFNSVFWLFPCVAGLVLITLVTFSPDLSRTSVYATFSDVGKLLMTPGIFYIVSKINVNSLINNGLFMFAKEMSFFAYAGHFLFCSMIMHTIASLIGFMNDGKATILILVFFFLGISVMAIIYKIGKMLLSHIMKLYDGTL